MVSFYIFKIAVCAYFQFKSGCIISYYDTLLMHLQSTDGPHLIDRTFYCMIERASFIMSVHPIIITSLAESTVYLHQSMPFGHFVYIIVEETGIGDDCISRQSLLTCAGRQRRTRFIEGNVSVRTNTTHKQVDTTVRLDFFFVTGTFSIQVSSIPRSGYRYSPGFDVDMAEEVIPHERVGFPRMFFGQTHILIHIKSNHVLKGNQFLSYSGLLTPCTCRAVTNR